MLRPPPTSTLFPYTTLFRSHSDSLPDEVVSVSPVPQLDHAAFRVAESRLDEPSEKKTPEDDDPRSEEHTSELQSLTNIVCRLLLEKKKQTRTRTHKRNTTKN